VKKDTKLECVAARVWDPPEKLGIDSKEAVCSYSTMLYSTVNPNPPRNSSRVGFCFGDGVWSNDLGCFMAKVLYPRQQKKAQQEINTVFNVETLPDLPDPK
jgi:hypothetical protein